MSKFLEMGPEARQMRGIEFNSGGRFGRQSSPFYEQWMMRDSFYGCDDVMGGAVR